MRRLLLDVTVLLGVALVALLVWAGQWRQSDPYLEKITASGILRIGIDPSYPPFATVKDGQIDGYEADLAHAIAADLGVRAEFVPLALDTLYDALEAGKVDMLVSSLPFVYERQADVRYSIPYYQAGQVLVVRIGETRIQDVEDLRGKQVGVELGSAADTEARRLARTEAPGMEVISDYESPAAAITALGERKIDIVITDNASARNARAISGGSIKVLPLQLTDEPFVIAMPSEATTLSTRVDAIIERLKSSGQLARLMGLRDWP